MIIDNLENAATYASFNPLFQKAFDFLNTTDLESLEIGTIQVAEGLKAIVSDKAGKTEAESLEKFECHNANLDIQFVVRGEERIGWKPRNTCVDPKTEYSAEKDVQFYNDAPDMYFQLKTGQFVILYPGDVHAPMIAVNDKSIKKVVFKVKI
ncbi:YhcH/YjgK/YiaL family protein [Polluticaenibacter yanchengensis]|uniref:YhcH/YjgK/YiaL family protein n=1 Tax=Polluticaenibacter yanchengensis TaxID=3014562 RepID=A0ABT4UJ22_9BACT|nr:YhcH/YjgK/YiaL family protein [Chitinophagaceae bacterium LY-5]